METATDRSVGTRIKELRKGKKLTQQTLAKLIGVNTSTISKWETGEQGLHADNAGTLASMLGVTVEYLMGREKRKSGLMASPRSVPLRVVGELQAGVWREAVELPPEDQETIPFFVPPEYRSYTMAAYVIRGNSMNMLYPSGSYVAVASTIANGITPRSGQKVLVSRRNRDGLYEATIKEYVVDDHGTEWLWPRSTSPEHQAPVRVRDAGTEEVIITGVVILAQVVAV